LSFADLRDLGSNNVVNGLLTRLYVVLGAENLDPGDPLHDFFVDRYANGRRLVADILAAEIDRGTIASDVDIDQIAREVLAVLMGLEIQWLMDPDHVDLATSVQRYIDRLTAELSQERP
jgi:hypothetical protein